MAAHYCTCYAIYFCLVESIPQFLKLWPVFNALWWNSNFTLLYRNATSYSISFVWHFSHYLPVIFFLCIYIVLMLNISMKCILANIATTYSEKYTTVCQYTVQHQFLILIKKYQQNRFLFYMFYLLYSICEMRNKVNYFWIQAKCFTFCPTEKKKSLMLKYVLCSYCTWRANGSYTCEFSICPL